MPNFIFIELQSFSSLSRWDLPGLWWLLILRSPAEVYTQNSISELHPKVLSCTHIPGLAGTLAQASWQETFPEPPAPLPRGAAAASFFRGAGIRVPGTWEPGPAQWPSFLAAWRPLANSCLCAASLPRICVAIHCKPPLGKAKKVALYYVKLIVGICQDPRISPPCRPQPPAPTLPLPLPSLVGFQ